MKVFIAGASGAVGRALIPALLERGHVPIGMVRSDDRASLVREWGAQAVIADGLERESVVAAMSSTAPDVVVHAMTALKEVNDLKYFDRVFAKTNLLRTTGTDNLVHAAKAANVGRIIAHSYGGWNYERSGSIAKRESDAFDPNPPEHQRESLAAIVHLERAVLESGIAGTVLRNANFYGPNTGIAPDGNLIELIRKRQVPVIGSGAGIWSWVHVNDVASATIEVIERGATGVYNVADDEPAPAAVWIPELAKFAHAGKPMRVPTFIGRLVAGDVGVSMMTLVRGADNSKARRELGWRPTYRSWREGFRAALAA